MKVDSHKSFLKKENARLSKVEREHNGLVFYMQSFLLKEWGADTIIMEVESIDTFLKTCSDSKTRLQCISACEQLIVLGFNAAEYKVDYCIKIDEELEFNNGTLNIKPVLDFYEDNQEEIQDAREWDEDTLLSMSNFLESQIVRISDKVLV